MSPPGRPKGEYRSAQHEGSPVSTKGRSRARISPSARSAEGSPISEIVIIGGGITGTAAAEALSRDGHAVTLIESKGIAAMASGRTLGGVRQSGRHPAE